MLRDKVRTEDCLGRFDESQFVLLVRRVDSALAKLIVNQLLDALAPIAQTASARAASLAFRCGVSGSGTGRPELATLIGRSSERCRQARAEGVRVCTDVETRSQQPAGIW